VNYKELQQMEQLQRMEDCYENTVIEDNTFSEEKVSNDLGCFITLISENHTKSPLSPEFCDPKLLSSQKHQKRHLLSHLIIQFCSFNLLIQIKVFEKRYLL
jgi:hypothetical protein